MASVQLTNALISSHCHHFSKLSALKSSGSSRNLQVFRKPFLSSGHNSLKSDYSSSARGNLQCSCVLPSGIQTRYLRKNATNMRGIAAQTGEAETAQKTRKVIEHLVLFKMKEDFEQSQEKDMLDNLYSLQYHYRNILAVSVGRIFSKRSNGFTHALFVRFPSQEALAQYTIHPSHTSVVEQYIKPYLEDILAVDFEADVEEDIEAIFRRGEDFEQGVEHLVLVKVKEGVSPEASQDMITALAELPDKLGSTIVQITAGPNFSPRSKGFTHGLVVRLPSEKDLEAYNKHPSHREVLRKHVLPNSESILAVDFHVEAISEANVM
eukprot:jgi/Mesen1/4873/ME000244S04050